MHEFVEGQMAFIVLAILFFVTGPLIIFFLFINYKINTKMADKQSIEAAFGRITAGLANLAGDIRTLSAKITPGMTQTDVDVVSADAEKLATSVEALAALTPDETPPPTV